MDDLSIKPIHIAVVGGEYICIPNNDVMETLEQLLQQAASDQTTATSYNIRSAHLQTIFDSFYNTTISTYPPKVQIYFAYRFLALKSLEEKKIGTMVISKLLDELTIEYIPDFERIFDNDIMSWEICDNFAQKILGPLIKKSDDFALKIAEWKDSGKVWRMRGACVTFVCLAKVGAMTELCFQICEACVRSSERFVQLGVGCLLREMSLMSSESVIEFITENYRYFSREGLRYSIDKLNSATRKSILTIGKNRKTKNQNNQNTQSVISTNKQTTENTQSTNETNLSKNVSIQQIQSIPQVQNISSVSNVNNIQKHHPNDIQMQQYNQQRMMNIPQDQMNMQMSMKVKDNYPQSMYLMSYYGRDNLFDIPMNPTPSQMHQQSMQQNQMQNHSIGLNQQQMEQLRNQQMQTSIHQPVAINKRGKGRQKNQITTTPPPPANQN